MSTKSSIAPAMAWNWLIQSLAIFKQVDPSTLAGVVPAAPNDLEKDSREMVSLKMLESLFNNNNEAINDTENPKISFDLSENCEDVLNRILDETSEPMTESERQKWNIRPFLMHKRASLSKVPLQKLKQELLEGSHPLLESLKERSNSGGINVPENSQNNQDTCPIDDLVSMNPAKSNKLPKSPSTSRITKQIKRKEHEITEDSPLKGLEENTIIDHNEQTPSKNLGQSYEDGNVDHGQHDDGENYMEKTESEKSDDELHDIAAKKEAFMNSQYTLSQDSMATMDFNEICLCMKCNKGGKLLLCNSDTCQVKVHEACLSITTTLDENWKFFCPFCAYSHAISEYLDLKKKASLARKDLQAFMSSGVKHRPKSTQTEKVKVNGNVDTVSDKEGKESHVSSLSRRCREKKPQYTSPKIPFMRRKKLQWTKSEVEILKEGVERFWSDESKGIPWRDILDFGRDVFHKSRTTVDVKDKWRNMCKGSPSKKPKL